MKKKLTKIISVMISMMIYFSMIPSWAMAESTADISINGMMVVMDNEPLVRNGCIMVSLDDICKLLSLELKKISSDKFHVSQEENGIEIQENNILAKKGTDIIELERMPSYINSKLYIPVSFLKHINYEITTNKNNTIAEIKQISDIKIEKGNVVVTSLSTEGKHVEGVSYEEGKNNADLSTNGVDKLSSNSIINSTLWYRFDASKFIGKKIKNAKIVFYAITNSAGNPTFSIYKVKDKLDFNNVDFKTFTNSNAELLSSKAYSDTGENIISKSVPSRIELDITQAFNGISQEDATIYLKLRSNVTTGRTTNVNGVNSSYGVHIYVDTQISEDFKVKQIDYDFGVENSYSFDNMKLLTSMGVIKDNEPLSTNRGEYVTRKEFVGYAMRLLNMDFSSFNSKIFDDVDNKTSFFNEIDYAATYGYVTKGGNFRPDDNISIFEASKVLSALIGYNDPEIFSIEWPYGYYNIANDAKIFKNVDLDLSSNLVSYEDMYNMLVNTLVAEGLEFSYGSKISYTKSKDENLLKKLWHSYIIEGVVTATKFSDIEFGKSSAGDGIKVDDKYFDVKDDSYYELLGSRIKLCYSEDDGIETVIYGGLTNRKNTSIVINASDIEYSTGDSNKIKIEYSKSGKTKKEEILKDMKIIYNGVAIDKTRYFNTKYLVPEIGAIRLIDNNSDGKYDVAYITAYRNLVVSTVDLSKKIIYDKSRSFDKIQLDEDDCYYSIKDLEGNEYQLSDLKENDVLSVAASRDEKVVNMLFSRNAVSGKIQRIDTLDNGRREILVDGYHCFVLESNKELEFKINSTAQYYLDAFGNIAGSLNTNTETMIGFLIGAYLEDFENPRVKLLTKNTDENGQVYDVSEKVIFNGVRADPDEFMANIKENNTVKKQLISFRLDTTGKIKYFNTVNNTSSGGNDQLIQRYSINDGQLIYKAPNFGGKYIVNNNTFMLSIPDDETTGEYEVVTSLKGNMKLNADIFSFNNYSFLANAILLRNYDTSSSIGLNDFLSVVLEAGHYEYDDYEDEVLMSVTFNTNGNERKVYVDPENESLMDDIHEGDIVRYTVNSKNKLQVIRKYYDAVEKKIVRTGGVFNDEVEIFGGFVYYKEDGYVRIVSDYNDVDDKGNIRVLDTSEIKNILYKDDISERNVKVTKATYNDIVDYHSSRTSATGIIGQTTYGNQYKTVLLVELDEFSESNDIVDDVGDELYTLKLRYNGEEYVYNKKAGASISLPGDIFTKPFGKIVAWTDGTDRVELTENYIMPVGDVVLEPVWETTSNYTIYLNEENIGATNQQTPNENVYNNANEGTNAISGADGTRKELWYKIDARDLIGKDIGVIKLVIAACKNFSGSPNISVYRVTENWDVASISHGNRPAIDTNAIYKTGNLDGYDNYEYRDIVLDITSLAENITEENPYIGIAVKSNLIAGTGTMIKGANSAQGPRLIVELKDEKTISFKKTDDISGDMEAVSIQKGAMYTIPQCEFTKPSHYFVGWEYDGVIYNSGDVIEVEEDVEFVPVWEFSGEYEVLVETRNAAHMVKNTLSWGGKDHSLTENGGYSLSSNNITANNGIGRLRSSRAEAFYKVDLSEYSNADIESIKLRLYVKRNGASDTIRVNSADSNMDYSTITGTNQPSKGSLIDSIVFQNSNSSNSDTYFDGDMERWVEFDLSSVIDELENNNHIIGLNISSNASNDGYLLYGPESTNKPYIIVKVN